jgi:uncharacterized membrane protein
MNWRSSLLGAFLAAGTLAVLIATFGVAIVTWVPIDVLRVIVGVILVLFGLKWLKKAILRYSGLKALHDEEAIFEEHLAEIKARGETPAARFMPFGVALSYKAVLLEGLEVAFIVITFGTSVASATVTKAEGLTSASIGAVVAGVLVILLGALVRAPLTRVPENTLKFVVGVMLTSFGTYWTGEGLGANWPLSDGFIPVLAILYLLATYGLISWLKQVKLHKAELAKSTADAVPVQQ